MDSYVQVKNWENFQQYKDRDPKWIKLYRDILVDYEFDTLTEIQQIHLVKIWLLASKLNNKIPNDPKWIARQIGAQSNVDINQLVTHGFLSVYESVQNCTETYLERETERETEKEKDTSTSQSTCPHVEIIEAYMQTLPALPKIVINRWKGSKSERNLRARWNEAKEHQSIEFWQQFFSVVKTNKFWLGENDRGWTADLHWLLERRNFDKVIQLWSNMAEAA